MHLLRRIERYLRTTDTPPTTFGRAAVRDPRPSGSTPGSTSAKASPGEERDRARRCARARRA